MNTITHHIQAFAVLAVLSGACNSSTPPEGTEEHHEEEGVTVVLDAAQFTLAGIELGKPELRAISGNVPVYGKLDSPPQNLVSISPTIGGFVRSTDLLEGLRVKKGQVLAVLEHPDIITLQQDYLENRSMLEMLRQDDERQQALAEGDVSAVRTRQEASSKYRVAQARDAALRERLKMIGIDAGTLTPATLRSTMNVYSPINGYVTEVAAHIGKFMGPESVLCRIVDTEHLHAELVVFERDVPKLRVGQKIRFTLANETTERTAKVYLIGRQIDTDRTIRVHGHLDDEDGELLPGMALNGVVELDSAQVWTVPTEAVVEIEGRSYVFAQEARAGNVDHAHAEEEEHGHDHAEPEPAAKDQAYHFEGVEVRVGVSELGHTEVAAVKGVPLQDRVIVTQGAYSLLSVLQNSEEEGGHAH